MLEGLYDHRQELVTPEQYVHINVNTTIWGIIHLKS